MTRSSNYHKVAVFYEFNSELWSTPFSLMRGFEKRGWKADRYHLSEAGINDFIASGKEYDIIISMDWKGLHFPRLSNKEMKSFMVAEFGDCPQNFEYHGKKLGNFDLILCPDYRDTNRLIKNGYDAVWFNHFADDHIHTRYNISDDMPKVRSTRGVGGSVFMDNLQMIMPDKFINMNGLTGIEYGKFLNSGFITLQNSRWGEITRRIFEGMACHTLVLTDRLSEETNIGELFTEGVDIVYYDNMADCIGKINYYLSREGSLERYNITENGYKKVMAEHTEINRATLIIEKYKTWNKKI